MARFSVRLVALVCFFASAGFAFAEGYGLYEWGARGMALGGAMYARKPDPSAVAYNPALLTKLKGRHVMGGVTAVSPTGKLSYESPAYVDNKSGTAKLKDSLWAIPHAYYTHQINDDWYFGVGEFTRFGLGFEYPHNWPGRFNIYQVSLVSGSLNPNIAWKATEKLSLAGGVELVYVNLDIKRRAPVPNPQTGSIQSPVNGRTMELDVSIKNAEAWGVGGNIAMHYQFNDQWAFGLQYRSQVKVHAFGDIEYTAKNVPNPQNPTQNLNSRQLGFEDGTAHSTVILPDSVMAGLSFTPIPELSIETSAVYTRWSMFRSLNIHAGRPDDFQSRKHWKDVWRLSAGVEYQALDWLTLRAGYTWDQSPMTDEFQDYLVPTDDRSIYSVGVGFQWDAWNLDLAYAYIDPQRRRYKDDIAGTGTIKSHTKESFTQLFSVSLGYEF